MPFTPGFFRADTAVVSTGSHVAKSQAASVLADITYARGKSVFCAAAAEDAKYLIPVDQRAKVLAEVNYLLPEARAAQRIIKLPWHMKIDPKEGGRVRKREVAFKQEVAALTEHVFAKRKTLRIFFYGSVVNPASARNTLSEAAVATGRKGFAVGIQAAYNFDVATHRGDITPRHADRDVSLPYHLREVYDRVDAGEDVGTAAMGVVKTADTLSAYGVVYEVDAEDFQRVCEREKYYHLVETVVVLRDDDGKAEVTAAYYLMLKDEYQPIPGKKLSPLSLGDEESYQATCENHFADPVEAAIYRDSIYRGEPASTITRSLFASGSSVFRAANASDDVASLAESGGGKRHCAGRDREENAAACYGSVT